MTIVLKTCVRMTIQRSGLFSLLVILLLTAFAPTSAYSQEPSEEDIALATKGYEIFSVKCVACHKLNDDNIGPALTGVLQRWEEAGEYQGLTGKQWLYRWIKNQNDPADAGYPYAVEMINSRTDIMNGFATFTDKDIDALLTYIQLAPVGEPVSVTPVASEAPAGGGGAYTNYFLYFLIGMLVVIAIILMRVSSVLQKLTLEKEGLPVPDPVPFYKNKYLRTLITLVVIIYIGSQVVNGAIDLGRQQGYAPVQPIKFSHELHAGTMELNCEYCHVGAAESKHAVIPSANICMNCHKAVPESRVGDAGNGKYGRGEIAKIFAAIGYNPTKRAYFEDYENQPYDSIAAVFTQWLKDDAQVTQGKNEIEAVLAQIQKPISWVRIHNLPDHVYFNHSQHVTVAGVECQTCHGPVEEMEVLSQHAPLSMGWCVNCHRDTPINEGQNDFYSSYTFHEEVTRAGQKIPVTVEKIGGTECQKCHY